MTEQQTARGNGDWRLVVSVMAPPACWRNLSPLLPDGNLLATPTGARPANCRLSGCRPVVIAAGEWTSRR